MSSEEPPKGQDGELIHLASTIEPVVASYSNLVSMDSGLMSGMMNGGIQDIKSFLSRPTVVSTGTWQSTTLASNIIAQVPIPESIITSTLAISQKIYGFYAFRAKAVLRLQVNCNRFQQGRLLMYFFPQDTISTRKYFTTTGSLYYATQLPRIDFDANTDTEVILEVPYVSPYLAYDTTIGTGHVGVVNLAVYMPLTSASSELTAEFSIWAHFEDVELMYPTMSNNTYVPQAGGARRLRVGSKIEDEAEVSGPVSTALMKVSRATGVLGEIPLLSSVATPASWVTAILSRSASALGFSNPSNYDQVTQVQQRVWNKCVNVSGKDNSIQMALQEDNHLEMLPSFASSGTDEMNFMHALSIPTWVKTVAWADSVVPLNVLYSTDLNPSSFAFVNAVGFDTIPVSYIANMFKYYRGSLKFRFKFAKTEFHSGRIAIVFMPGYTGVSPPTLSDARMTYLHKDVVDIRGITEYEFVAPWVANTPYLLTSEAYGHLSVAVINELRHPDTVAATINFVVEVSCADDFQFAVPYNAGLVPFLFVTNSTPQAADSEDPKVSVGQKSALSQPKPSLEPIGETSLQSLSLSPAKYAVGEAISSFRQLIKRAIPYLYFVESGGQDTNYLFVQSNIIPTYNNTLSAWVNNMVYAKVDYLCYAMNCFAFARGSVRYRVYGPNTGQTGLAYMNSVALLGDVPFSPAPTVSSRDSTADAQGFEQVYPAVVPTPSTVYPNPEISCPYYNKYSQHAVVSDDQFQQVIYQQRPTYWLAYRNNQGNITYVTRQAGDDYSLGMWVGSCPLASPGDVISGATNTPNW